MQNQTTAIECAEPGSISRSNEGIDARMAIVPSAGRVDRVAHRSVRHGFSNAGLQLTVNSLQLTAIH